MARNTTKYKSPGNKQFSVGGDLIEADKDGSFELTADEAATLRDMNIRLEEVAGSSKKGKKDKE